jgi:hypothetical protein
VTVHASFKHGAAAWLSRVTVIWYRVHVNADDIAAELIAYGLGAADVDRVIDALRDGGGLARIVSAHVPPATEPYVALRDASDLTLAYVHKGFVDLRIEVAPDRGFEVDHYEGIHRVPFPGYRNTGRTTRRPERKPLANCPVHFVPTNPDGTCDSCEP